MEYNLTNIKFRDKIFVNAATFRERIILVGATQRLLVRFCEGVISNCAMNMI